MTFTSGSNSLKKIACLAVSASILTVGVVYAQLHAGPGANFPNADKDFTTGLDMWRAPDARGFACAFCHTPDGLEIASYNFDDENIHRRAVPHLGNQGADEIVKFIHEVRKRNNITALLDPMKDRPLQPGGEVLPGATPAERDLAFAKELQTALPILATGNVDSLQKAEMARDELLALDPRKLKIGILFNRISEDGFHGTAHATFANWIADTPLRFHFPWPEYFLMQNNYLRNPSDKSLLGILEFPHMHQAEAYGQYSQLMTNDKYRALLVYSHILRTQFHGGSAFDEAGPVLLGKLGKGEEPNPLLDLGVFADARSETPFGQFRFPDDILAKKEKGITEADQLKQIRLPSLYAGWMMDQGLMRSKGCPEPRATRIVTERLLSDGPYPMLDAFLITKKLVEDGFAPEAWSGPDKQHFTIDYSAFLLDGNFKKFEPKDPTAKALYRKFVANSFKMSLLLRRDQDSKTIETYPGDPSDVQIPLLRAFVKQSDPAFDEKAAQ